MKILKEDLTIPLGIVAYLLLNYVGSLVYKNAKLGGKDVKGEPLPSDNVMNAQKQMWKDKAFLKDFAKILSDQGDFDVIAKQLEDNSDLQIYDRWQKIKKPNFKPSGIAKTIISRLLKTSSYKRLSKANNFTKEDEATFAKLLYLIISSDNFTRNAKQYILGTMEKGWLDDPNIYPANLHSKTYGL